MLGLNAPAKTTVVRSAITFTGSPPRTCYTFCLVDDSISTALEALWLPLDYDMRGPVGEAGLLASSPCIPSSTRDATS